MIFPIVIHKEKRSDYGVIVPDLPGCFSAGKTLDEALAMAQEAIELHLEGLIEIGQSIPVPGKIEQRRNNPDYAGGTWALVNINADVLRVNCKRINITIPERVLDAADRYARQNGLTRSGLLAQAVSTYIGQDTGSAKHTRPGRRKKRTGKAA
jgi:predicted RNase H-like HicB family nuclease